MKSHTYHCNKFIVLDLRIDMQTIVLDEPMPDVAM